MKLRLEISEPGKTPRSVELEVLPCVVGRQAPADLILDDPKVSRSHLRLESDGTRLLGVDTGSSNGFRLNGRSETETTLEPGDTLGLGRTQVKILEWRSNDAPDPPVLAERSAERRAPSTPSPIPLGPNRRLQRAIAALLILGTIGGVATWVWRSDRPGSGTGTSERTEARRALEVAHTQLLTRSDVDVETWNSTRRLLSSLSHLSWSAEDDPQKRLESALTERR
ncbi:MAG: FHA domain-containing protein, partial [Planctomycetes bacterium]|nr:FHA domain-containing protein [Planctomycetota bacterium]